MKFALVDRVLVHEPGRRIVTVKAITQSEEYLADHFPTFPVLPGVLMLQVLVESASWLVRAARDFAESLVLLQEAKNVSYKNFVQPGQVLRAEVTCGRLEAAGSDFTATGRSGDVEVVKARFTLRHCNLADRHPQMAELDDRIRREVREQWAKLAGSTANGIESNGVRV